MNAQAVKFYLDRLSKVKLEKEEYIGTPNRIEEGVYLELIILKARSGTTGTDPILIKIADIVSIEPIL